MSIKNILEGIQLEKIEVHSFTRCSQQLKALELLAYGIIATGFLFLLIFLRKRKRQLKLKNSFVNRFKKKFKLKNRMREKIKVEMSDSLMANPNRNIKMSIWDKEDLLREKAEIHRTRLSKYGQSKLNGEVFFREKNGEIYKHSSAGEKIYI